MSARKLGYDFLEKGFDPPKSANEFVLCEVVSKVSTKKSASGIVYAPRKEDTSQTKPYLIVRDIPETEVVRKALPQLKVGDVIEQSEFQLVTFLGPEEGRFAAVHYSKIAVVYSKNQGGKEEYIEDLDLDLSGTINDD